MRPWRLNREPSLDDLFDDEIMIQVMHSDGLDETVLRRLLHETAGRLDGKVSPMRRPCLHPSCCEAAAG